MHREYFLHSQCEFCTKMVSKCGLFLVFVCTIVVDVFSQDNFDGIIVKGDKEKLLAKIGPFLQKCLEESGVNPKELETMQEKPSSEKLCFFKCLAIESRTIEADGTILHDKLKENLQDFGFPDDHLDQAVECLNKVEQKIQTCEDMMAFESCRPAIQ